MKCSSPTRCLRLGFCLCLCFTFALHAQTDDPTKVDDDGDGLIEVWNLTHLDHMRHNLAGTSYKATSGGTAVTTGCPTTGGCTGYELMADLDFSDPTATGYQEAWDGEVQTPKGNSAGAGFVPIGDGSTSSQRFTGTFEGNGHQIKNLYVNASAASGTVYAGLFGETDGATIRNVGLTGEHMSVKGGSASTSNSNNIYVGAMVGYSTNTTIRNCYATGDVSATTSGSGDVYAGGMAGRLFTSVLPGGRLVNCYATGDVSASAASGDAYAGGLVGEVQLGSSLKNVYAAGNVTSASSSARSLVGGLVGQDVGIGSSGYHSGTVPASGVTVESAGTATTLDGLRRLTAASTGWSTKDWEFGTSEDLPVLQTYKEVNGLQVQGKLLRGQPFSLTPDGLVGELRTLVGDYTTNKDVAVSGEDYLRLRKVLADLKVVEETKMSRKEGDKKANRSDIYTKQKAVEQFAPKVATATRLTALTTKVGALEVAVGLPRDEATDTSLYSRVARNQASVALRATTQALNALKGDVTALVGDVGDADSPAAGTLYALLAQNKTDMVGKVAQTLLDTEQRRLAALEGMVGAKPTAAGTAETLWEEAAALRTAIRSSAAAGDLSDYAKKAEVPSPPDLSGLAKKTAFDAMKKRVEALGGGGDPVFAKAWLETRVVVRPNPVRDRLILRSPVSVSMTLLDVAGNFLLRRELSRGEQSVDVSGLVSGSYLLVFQTTEGKTQFGPYKFIKE